MLVGTDNGGIQHHVFIVAIFDQEFEDPLKNATFAPSPQASVGVFPVAEALGKILPRNPGVVAIKHGLDKAPIIGRLAADVPLTTGKKILDPLPLIVPQSITTHQSAPNHADLLRIIQILAAVDSYLMRKSLKHPHREHPYGSIDDRL
jgi:hypothetical protein